MPYADHDAISPIWEVTQGRSVGSRTDNGIRYLICEGMFVLVLVPFLMDFLLDESRDLEDKSALRNGTGMEGYTDVNTEMVRLSSTLLGIEFTELVMHHTGHMPSESAGRIASGIMPLMGLLGIVGYRGS